MKTELSIEESTLAFARNLIQRESVTPQDRGCQQLICDALRPVGFICESLNCGEVRNLWAKRGNQTPLIVFAGHTDVVPAGPLDQWQHPPFSATICDGLLHGRGAADMKGSIAAMVTACQRFTANNPDHIGSIAFLFTSDEEGAAIDGTRHVVEQLQIRGESLDWCIVGEPTSCEYVGDTIKNGRRGSLDGTLTLRGVQGHVAYAHVADNPIHRAAPLISKLVDCEWDNGNEVFPPTSFQISNIKSGTGARNVIPGDIQIFFNLRFSPESNVAELEAKVEMICRQYTDTFAIEWRSPSPVYYTPAEELVEVTRKAIQAETGLEPALTTDGGTSDGRFISKTGAQVIELGPVNHTIHSTNECVKISDLTILSRIYEGILLRLLV